MEPSLGQGTSLSLGFLTYKMRASVVSETPSTVDILWLGDRERGRSGFLHWPGLFASHCFSPLPLSLGPRDLLAVTRWSRTPKFVVIWVTSIETFFSLSDSPCPSMRMNFSRFFLPCTHRNGVTSSFVCSSIHSLGARPSAKGLGYRGSERGIVWCSWV